MHYQEFLGELYVKSLTPFEILEVSEKFSCENKSYEKFNYLEYWKKTISKDGSDDDFVKYCLLNNLTSEELITMTANVIVSNEEIDLPDWLKVLNDIWFRIDSLPLSFISTNSQEKSFYYFFAPFIDYFLRKITEVKLTLNVSLIEQLKDIVYNELYEMAQLVLDKEAVIDQEVSISAHRKIYVPDKYKDKYQFLFLKYPMLARKLLTKTYYITLFVKKIFNNIYQDKKEIEALFSKAIGEIVKLHLNAGDLHNGESTVVIEFDDSYKIVYKPTNIGITSTYNSFINWINDKLNEKLKTFKVLDKGSYGWMEFVEYSPCDTISDICNYYERAGILLGVAHMLNSKDFHRENVIASGSSPVLIDHETLLSPLLKKLVSDENRDGFDITGTVLETSLIPTLKLDLPLFMYGFGSSETTELNKESFDIKNYNTYGVKLKTDFIERKISNFNKPIFNGSVENLANYQVEFKRGFKKFYDLVMENKEYLLSSKSPIMKFSSYDIRFVNRQTKVYYSILKHLNRPEYLSNALKFGIKLEVLARGYLNVLDRSALLHSERMQMLEGNIPIFHISTVDEQLKLSNSKKINMIERTAMENVCRKIKEYSLEDYDYQMTLILDSVKL